MTKNSLKQKQMTANHNKAKNIKDWLRTQHITHWSVFITFSPLFHSILAQLSPILCQRDSHFPLHFHFEGISPLVFSNFSIH